MYVLPLGFFFSMRNSWGFFFFFFLGGKSCKIRGDTPRLWDVPGWCGIFQSCPFCSWGMSRGLRCLTNLLWLLCWSWGCCHGKEGFYCTDRGVKTHGVIFSLAQVWARYCSSSAQADLGSAAKGKVGHSGIQGLSLGSVLGPATPEEKSW